MPSALLELVGGMFELVPQQRRDLSEPCVKVRQATIDKIAKQHPHHEAIVSLAARHSEALDLSIIHRI